MGSKLGAFIIVGLIALPLFYLYRNGRLIQFAAAASGKAHFDRPTTS